MTIASVTINENVVPIRDNVSLIRLYFFAWDDCADAFVGSASTARKIFMDETTRGLVFCGFSIIQKGEKKNNSG
jgi:hypothetical protein